MNTAGENPEAQQSDICYKCCRAFHNNTDGKCSVCDGATSSSGFTLCFEHAVASNTCACCGGALDAVRPPIPPVTKLVWDVAVNADYYADRLETPAQSTDLGAEGKVVARDLVADRSQLLEFFKLDVAELLAKQGQTQDAVEIINERPISALMLIKCTVGIAEAIKALPGVLALSEH